MSGLVMPFKGRVPRIAADAFVAPNAIVIGEVEIGPRASLWYSVVLRADVAPIRIGAESNLQDGTIVHVDEGFPTLIGERVLVGHMAVVHGCTLEDGAFVGMKACVMDGAVVGSGALVAAGALVTEGKQIPAGQLWAGTPAKYLRELRGDERAAMEGAVDHYIQNAIDHRESLAAR